MTTAANILKQARDYIAQPYCWTKGASTRTVRRGDTTVVAHCAFGAVRKFSSTQDGSFWIALDILRDGLPDPYSVTQFNDRSKKREVLAAFDRAIEKASR